jgi:hypothetical protein
VGVKRGFNGIEFAKLVNMTPRTVGVMDVHGRYDVSTVNGGCKMS